MSSCRQEVRPPRLPTNIRLASRRRPAAQPARLLEEALAPLETSSEIYEMLVSRAQHEDLLHAAQSSLQRVVEGIAMLGHRIDEIAGSQP